ncbi:MAG TPA: Vms1/Ankzf1 family peptidyl-tRNA hydrolase [Intrasporangium sp.]|uniref:baeRF2 domain-containing protein n=1 Tax=Intrasporangium sp. TaxID=1925024 RepID=UPI002D771915|nr:Vms1/Ankzf1 family peptidyl-tRNA hydrolase [Intrasporangium sp.]HET7397125.1 Vms1/Ankzf1 family peptidyl-tRNA hydrolase [Intrasporangium sp.]
MLLRLLEPLRDVQPPFATVCLDASRVDPANEDKVEARWSDLARHLEARGAPAETIEALSGPALEPTGHGGEHTRVLVASGDTVALDLVLPGRPAREEAGFGRLPHLMPVARALATAVPHVVARIDRSGADLEFVGALGDVEDEEEVTGGHDVIHKVPGGGWAQRRYESRAEDSWERNATAVAEELGRVVARHRPELVLVAGDDKAVAALEAHAGHELAQRLVRIDSGGRGAGTSEAAEREAIERALEEHRRTQRQALLDRLSEQLSRQQEAVEGLDAVVEVLRRGQVAELLLWDDPTATTRLWVGEEPLQIGLSRRDAGAAGATEPVEVRADAALLWGLLGSSAGITVLDRDDHPVRDGVAALLRWSDVATPHSGVPSMPGHGEPPGAANPV